MDINQETTSNTRPDRKAQFNTNTDLSALSSTIDDAPIEQMINVFEKKLSRAFHNKPTDVKQLTIDDVNNMPVKDFAKTLSSMYLHATKLSERDIHQIRFILAMYEERTETVCLSMLEDLFETHKGGMCFRNVKWRCIMRIFFFYDVLCNVVTTGCFFRSVHMYGVDCFAGLKGLTFIIFHSLNCQQLTHGHTPPLFSPIEVIIVVKVECYHFIDGRTCYR